MKSRPRATFGPKLLFAVTVRQNISNTVGLCRYQPNNDGIIMTIIMIIILNMILTVVIIVITYFVKGIRCGLVRSYWAFHH